MRICIVSDSFPPLKNSAAVLVFSLAEALASLGHELLVVTPGDNVEKSYAIDDFGSFKALRIRCGKIKSHNKFIRGISELSLFFSFPREFKKTPFAKNQWDILIWYSPSIFLSGIIKYLQKLSRNRYLILRDIVPDWMVDVGIMKKGASYYLLKCFEHYQYRLADVIGVQSPGNMKYIEKLRLPKLQKLEVLENWMPSTSTIHKLPVTNHQVTNLKSTILKDKKVFIYAGNLGKAQDIEDFADALLFSKDNPNIGFLILGRGSQKEWLESFVKLNNICNVLILDEVDLPTLSAYYQQSYAGIVFLDAAHQSHNIPGKFISYLEAGLPVAACVNPGNDLVSIIKNEDLGFVAKDPVEFSEKLHAFAGQIPVSKEANKRSRDYYEKHYQPLVAARKILHSFPALEIERH
jgi:glycosyltransferase involved in cell wall biosynthesis